MHVRTNDILVYDIHVHKYHRKKPAKRVPIYTSVWVHKHGANSWIARSSLTRKT